MTAAALGNFDGVHLAHRSVLEKAAAFDDSVCVMFREHPSKVLFGKEPKLILSPEDNVKKILNTGIKKIEYLDFAEVMDYEPRRFFEEILIKKFGVSFISCGYNYTFGREGKGDVRELRELCREYGAELCALPEVEYKGEAVSSTRIRHEIERGNIEDANVMLGYKFFYHGEIVMGNQLGRQLGFATINQMFTSSAVKPLSGVYLSQVEFGDEIYSGITNIGDNPTVGENCFRSETHILNFERDVYGKDATVSLEKFIRGEKKFSSLEELSRQVHKDIERAEKKANV